MPNRASDLNKAYKTYSDCPDTIREQLQQEVEKHCKSEKKKCNGKTDSCADLEKKMDMFNKCMQARITINTKCFRGGDDGHNKAIEDANNGLLRCQKFFFSNCIEPEQVPVPVIQPAPATQPNEDFLKKMEKITGLTGAALIIYLIISEGSRLFIPRNAIPVP